MTDPQMSMPLMAKHHRRRKTKSKNKNTTKGAKRNSKRETASNLKRCLGVKCPICLGRIRKINACSTLCGHIFCAYCIKKYSRTKKECPTCRRRWKIADGFHALLIDDSVQAPFWERDENNALIYRPE